MKLGDLCRSQQVTAFYVTHHKEDHDRHGEVYPSDILMYLGESYERFSKVVALSSGKSGWTLSSYLEAL